MATQNIDFSDVKIILCAQGYPLDYQFVLKEIGFWCDGHSSSIPINLKLNRNHMDLRNQNIVQTYEDEVHGLKLKRNFENGLAFSDVKAVLRTLYHFNSNTNAKYIGICKDEPLEGLLFKSGLGNYVTHLENLNFIKNITLPTNENIRLHLKKSNNQYMICRYHDRLQINEFPSCSKVKAQFLADFISNVIKCQPTPIEGQSKVMQTFINEFDFGN